MYRVTCNLMSQFDYGFGSPRVEISLDSRGALAVPHMGAYIVKGVTMEHFYLKTKKEFC